MESLLILVNIILAVILIIVILLQRSEGGALGLGVSQDNFTSSRSVSTFLTRVRTTYPRLVSLTCVHPSRRSREFTRSLSTSLAGAILTLVITMIL